ncbi:hypothetical protein IW262DRAFT_1263026 [Armillaria fumosa]|nr:hypothetical protein IW262DRAFT_1263026 [Armillaria fumosa]
MPHFNDPYTVLDAHSKTSSYTLKLTKHLSHLLFKHSQSLEPNNPTLFSHCDHPHPQLIITADSFKEFFIDRIVDEHKQGHGLQYLVHWVGEREEKDCWLPWKELEDCEALNNWLTLKK